MNSIDRALFAAEGELDQMPRAELEDLLDILQNSALQSIEAIAAKAAVAKELDVRGYTASVSQR